MRMRGFTIIEYMILLAIVGIVITVAVAGFSDKPRARPAGVKEFNLEDGTRCVSYYQQLECDWKK